MHKLLKFAESRQSATLALLCWLVFAPGMTSAAVISIQITGVAETGFSAVDSFGLFSAPGTNLAGDPFVETATVNDSRPYGRNTAIVTHPIHHPSPPIFVGFDATAFPPGLGTMDETLTIAGKTIDMDAGLTDSFSGGIQRDGSGILISSEEFTGVLEAESAEFILQSGIVYSPPSKY